MVRDGLLPKRQALRLRQFGGQKKRQIEAALDLIEGNEPQALTVSRVRVDRKKIESTVARLTGEPADWVKRVQDLSQRTASVTAAMVALMTLDPETRYKTWNSVGKPVKNRILANSSALAKVLDDFVRTFRNLKLPVKPVESKVIVDKPKSGKDKTRKKTARQATLNVSTATRVIRVLDAVFGKSENRRTVNLGLSNIRGRIGSDLTDSQLRKQVVGAFAVFKEYWNTPVSSTSLQWRKALFGRFTEIRRQFGFHHTAANFSEFVKDLQARSRASDAVQLTRFTDEH
jgi:hypothetical protein